MLSSWTKSIWLTIFALNAMISSPANSKDLETTKPDDVPALIKLLRNGKAEIRENAAYKLGMLWPKQDSNGAVSALINAKVEIARLIECVELLCEARKPELTLIRRVAK